MDPCSTRASGVAGSSRLDASDTAPMSGNT